MRYWAFLSYSRRDERWVRSLHRRLEAFRIPRDVAVPDGFGRRIRPVFRDRDELAVSADLPAELTGAIDRSRSVVLIASADAAASRYVDAEMRHVIDRDREADLRVVVLDPAPDGSVPLPAALRERGTEPLWLDARGTRRPRRSDVVRLVAGMLGVSFDVLRRRDRRQRRRRLSAALAAVLLVVGAATTVVVQQRRAEQVNRPEQQVAAFDAFFRRKLLAADPGVLTADKLDFRILRTDDLNGDRRLDFIVFNQTSGWCGSRGCGTDAYLTEEIGRRYRTVANLFSTSTPRTRPSPGSFLDIVSTDYTVDGEPIYTVRRWRTDKYEVHHYEYCHGVAFEYCIDPVLITPITDAQLSGMRRDRGVRLYIEPDVSTPRPRDAQEEPPLLFHSIVGTLDGGRWVLVNFWKGRAGFARRSDLSR